MLSVSVWAATYSHPKWRTKKQRRLIARDIRRLSKTAGISTRKSTKRECTLTLASDAPASSGIYRFYYGEEIVYIGTSGNIQRRIGEHIEGSHNKMLHEFLQSGYAQVDWYRCLYRSWMERYELTEFKVVMGRRPVYNKIGGGLPY